MMRNYLVLALALCLLAGCSAEPTPAPDLVATQIAVEKAAHATLTAEAPTSTPTPEPTETPVPTDTPRPTDTPVPTSTPTNTPESTDTPVPTSTPTDTPAPTLTATLEPTPAPKPTEKPTAKPEPTVEKASLDRYRVYYSNYQGNTVADQQNTFNYSLWSMRGDGTEATMLFTEAQQPALSVDETKLAYVHIASGIFVQDLVTGEHKHVITHSSAQSPSFSPDGYRLTYAEYTVSTWWQIFTANSQVHITNVDGTNNATALVGRRPIWSPTSNLIAYEACEGTRCGILILNVDNGNTRFLVGNSAGKASWSPDGQRITYSTDEDGDSEIWSVNLDGTGTRKLTDNMSTDALASWSPDGQRIYFLSDRKGGWGIWVMRPDGTDPRRIQSIGVPQYWQWARMSVGWNR